MVDSKIDKPDGYEIVTFTWDENSTSKNLQLLDENLTVIATGGSTFKSVLGNKAFTPGGRYYFEVYLISVSLLKIGVCRKTVNIEQAFSDTADGWAIYKGELRHASNTGNKYATVMKVGDKVGVMLDMIEGKLSFSINGEIFGVAYESEEFKKGELHAACALFYQGDQFRLNMLAKDE